ncbi:MAG: hypothetical protein GY716_07650 [bacterium]|nr:hypothetical protein [bacterium]
MIDVERELDRLFGLPLSDFTADRNALVKDLRDRGLLDEAKAVKALVKPSVTAWAANQAFREEREAFDHLLEMGGWLRDAQAGALHGRGSDDLHRAKYARREALDVVAQHALQILERNGNATGPAVTRKLEHTLEALATFGDTRSDIRPGRLTRDLEPPGLDVLMRLAQEAPPPKKLRVPRSQPPKAKKPSARQEVAKANRALSQAQKLVDARQADSRQAKRQRSAADARVNKIREQINELQHRVEQARFKLKEATNRFEQAAEADEEAQESLEKAQDTATEAQAALDRLTLMN